MMRAPRLTSLLGRFRRSERGVAAIELALLSPVLVLLLIGGYDVARFVSIRANVDKVGFSVADVTSQYKQLTPTAMTQIFKITGSSLTTYDSGSNGVTILTSVYLDSTKTVRVKWQCFSSNGTSWKSRIGVEGAVANIDPTLVADANDNVMVSELFYKFTPIFSTVFKTGFDIYTSSIYRPRLGSLTTKPC